MSADALTLCAAAQRSCYDVVAYDTGAVLHWHCGMGGGWHLHAQVFSRSMWTDTPHVFCSHGVCVRYWCIHMLLQIPSGPLAMEASSAGSVPSVEHRRERAGNDTVEPHVDVRCSLPCCDNCSAVLDEAAHAPPTHGLVVCGDVLVSHVGPCFPICASPVMVKACLANAHDCFPQQ